MRFFVAVAESSRGKDCVKSNRRFLLVGTSLIPRVFVSPLSVFFASSASGTIKASKLAQIIARHPCVIVDGMNGNIERPTPLMK
jgi:hypothetical protein